MIITPFCQNAIQMVRGLYHVPYVMYTLFPTHSPGAIKRGFKNELSTPAPRMLNFPSGDGLVTVFLGSQKQ